MQMPCASCEEIVKNREMTTLGIDSYLAHIGHDTQLLAATLAHGSALSVPSCPGWDLERLVGHLGRVHRMATTVVGTQSLSRPEPNPVDLPPDQSEDLSRWLVDGAQALTDVLSSTPPESPAWNFTNAPKTAAFWPRRQAHETAVHRVDGQLAVGSAEAIDQELAVDGVDEFFEIYGGRIPLTHPGANLRGSLHLHATDGADGFGEWMIAVTEGVLTISHGHAKGDAAIRGTASHLMLGLWGRNSLLDESLFEHFGDRTIVSNLIELTKA
jgi:uncharacterized protein (TIGR03083 family)